MVLISYGTLKSASSFAWQIVDLHLKTGFPSDKAYNDYRTSSLPIKYHNVHFEIIDKECEELVSMIPEDRTYHFKTHSVFNNIAYSRQSKPVLSSTLARHLKEGRVKVIGSIRDPREIVLSAMDHSNRKKQDGSFFSGLSSLEDTFPHIKRNFEKASMWHETGLVQWIPYDLVLTSPFEVNNIISNYLGFNPERITTKLSWLLANKSKIVQYNKGTPQRYKAELSLTEQAQLAAVFSSEISMYEEIVRSVEV